MIAINVAQLLKLGVGSTRDFEFDEAEPDLERAVGVRGPVRGRAHLLRTGRGILVEAEYQTTVELSCGRCLETFLARLSGAIEEEFVPLTDVISGEPLEATPDEFHIDPNHVLDLTEAVRQDVVLRIPLQPLCSEVCQGLCPQCGAARNREACECRPVADDSPFQALAQLLERESRENGQEV